MFCEDVESPDDVFDFIKGSPGNVLGYQTESDRVLVVLVFDVVFT